jgi:hypothetical protein
MGDRPEIAEAVRDCVEYAFDDERPFRKISDFLFILNRSGWREDDLVAVKSLVLAEWSKRSSAELS